MKRLQHTQTTFVMFNKSELQPLGYVKVETLNSKNERCFLTEYTVVPEGYTPLLGSESVQQFCLITVHADNIMSLLHTASMQLDLVSEFHDIFSGEGKLEGKLHLEIDKSVPPVALPVRKVPFAVTDPLKQELERLVKTGVLQPVDVPTNWVSSMVVVKKSNGKIRLCIDPKSLNVALKRNHYPLPVIDDLLPLLAKAKVFSVVDARNGFWHVQLDNESSFRSTFGTPWGRFRWTRMPFGISPALEQFQRRLEQALEGLEGVKPIFDDILIFGVGETQTEALAYHDAKLRALFERCRKKSIKLNKEKVKLRCTEVKFMGHVICQDGLKPDPDKVQGIREMPAPTSKQDLKRFLGMRNEFQWDEEEQGHSFKQVKEILSAAPVLKFFDPKESVELQCDASNKGLGACLMQGGQPVAYASRCMTETEVNYAQIEKELLAILFGCVYGRRVEIETDHKPLESIFKKSLLSAPKRLQRMMLRLQKFDLLVSYKKGTEMYLADTLSRAFRMCQRTRQDTTEDVVCIEELRSNTERELEFVNMIQYLPVSEATQTAIKQATESDATLRDLKTVIREGERRVIPASVKDEMLAKIHASHIGIQGSLRRAREVIYWPGMNEDVEDYVSKCTVCSSQPVQQGKEPLICHELSNRPWEKIAVDLFYLNGTEFVVTVDYYSSFFEVDKLRSKTAEEVVKKLKAHLARHGIPDQLCQTTTILLVNGEPLGQERVKTAKSLLEKAAKAEQDPYLALLDWRNTPTETLNSSPVQRLFGRRTKTLLPTSNRLLKPKLPEEVDQKLKLQKAKQSLQYNKGAKELEELRPGDTVRF
ncbi:Retrovirus-related Pol polyprotein from transposon 17.6 [Acropora cervicornis]|uniref:Retrovirus-related Pol polyprotein from transposon 17.6 n=1 Tax=Acropora cervicornis TaxID=6130 RepID=A0AAD9QNM3_ACRCE|nr:Retrovirus-related Pol polyprotein from transposon 17.6 [Acropora cervicornis]